jgi:hypothetical protein
MLVHLGVVAILVWHGKEEALVAFVFASVHQHATCAIPSNAPLAHFLIAANNSGDIFPFKMI